MATLTVGTSGTYATIAAAVAASRDGDVVQVQAGTYTNDFVHVTTRITIEGVGGVVKMVATVAPPDGKAIMTIGADATVSNLDFSGAQVADGNGAGIRYEGGNLTLQNCTFHDNQNGLLSAAIPGGQLTINNCSFVHNGSGTGQTHNLYVGDIAQLTITNSTFKDAVVGHEIKSRAENTIIQNCVIADGPTGNASYSIDLPNGGNATITGNTIEKGPNAENQTIIHYGGEAIAYAGSQLTISGNTVTNDLTAHSTILLTNQTLINATITGNTFLGVPIPTYTVGPATLTNNRTATGAVPDSTQMNLGGTGNTIYVTGTQDQTVTLPNPGMAIAGGAGHLTATGFSHETVVGGAGGLTWNGQDGADQVYTQAGTTNVLSLGHAGSQVSSAGTDTIAMGIGNNGVGVTGAATLSGGTGNNSIQVDGSAVITDAGTDFISVGAKGNASITSTGYVSLNSNGGTFALSHLVKGAKVADTMTVAGGGASLLSLDTGLAVTMAGGAKGATITLGTGNHQVISGAPDTIRAGSGSDTVIVSGNAQVYGGTGALSVFGRGIQGMATVHGASGTTVIDGDTGNITFLAEGGAATLDDRLSRISVVGGAGQLTVNAKGGQLTVQGGAGGLLFNDSTGNHVITTAAGARDTLNLAGGSTVTSNGSDAINIGSGDNFAVTANGAATIRGGTGNSFFTLNGADSLLTRSSGIDHTTVGAKASVQIVSTSARDLVEVHGGRLTYLATGGATAGVTDAVTISGQAVLDRASGARTSVVTQADGSAQVDATTALSVFSYGHDTVSAGAGTLSMMSWGDSKVQFGAGGGRDVNFGNATVTGGAGSVSLESWGGSLSYVGGSGAATIDAEIGNATVSAGRGNMTLKGGSGSVLLKGGAGSTFFQAGNGGSTVVAGAGATTVNAGGGVDVLDIQAGFAHGPIVVNGFIAGQDQIKLEGYAAGAASVKAGSGGVTLALNDGTRVLFTGVSRLPGFS